MALNRDNWDERAAPHAASPDYSVERFVAEPDFLSGVVEFDRPRLGDVAGLRGVHLQCHIGTDTLSLHRLGARMTGLDFSPAAVAEASALAARVGADIPFVQSDVQSALDVLPAGEFDLVYTGIGAICWLPSIREWAAVVNGLLAERRGRKVDRNANAPAMRRERLDIGLTWNIDVKHLAGYLRDLCR